MCNMKYKIENLINFIFFHINFYKIIIVIVLTNWMMKGFDKKLQLWSLMNFLIN